MAVFLFPVSERRMKIVFHLGWNNSSSRRLFKSPEAGALFTDYAGRIKKFVPCEAAPSFDFSKSLPAGEVLWLCDFHSRSKMISSEELSSKIDGLSASGARILHIAIGPANGFGAEERRLMKPDMIWSFGPMTLPHELAAVVASEQVYRAWTILRNLPYHQGHL